MFQAGIKFTLVDVRTMDELASQGKFPGNVIHIELSEFSANTHKIPRHLPVIVACKSGVRSEHAAEILMDDGFKDVYNLLGGHRIWKLAVHPKSLGAEL